MSLVIIQTTCANKKEAKKIAKALVKEKLAACVQISRIKSFYMWDEKMCSNKETLLNIKTIKDNFTKVKSKIKELHSYDVPEIIQLNITNSSDDYKIFIKGNTI